MSLPSERERDLSRKPLMIGGAVILGLLAYLSLLAIHGWQAEPDLLVLYRSGPSRAPPVHPGTGRLAWADPAAVSSEVERVQHQRGSRLTELLDAAPVATSTRRIEHEGSTVALVELAKGGLPAVVAELQREPAALVVVATCEPVAEVERAIRAPLAVLPGCFGPGVSGAVELEAVEHLVGPWVDSRWRLGELRVVLGAQVELAAKSVSLRTDSAHPGADAVVGLAGEDLEHDLIRFDQGGLGGALAHEVKRRTGADLALFNYLSLREGLAGPVTMTQIERSLPFHNQVVLVTMPGRDILNELSHNRAMDTRYLLVAGASATPDGDWVLDDGRALSPDLSLRVATIDYLADGGRGKRLAFSKGIQRLDTGLYTDRIAIDLLAPPAAP